MLVGATVEFALGIDGVGVGASVVLIESVGLEVGKGVVLVPLPSSLVEEEAVGKMLAFVLFGDVASKTDLTGVNTVGLCPCTMLLLVPRSVAIMLSTTVCSATYQS